MCKVGEIVVVGGVRRSALISLSDLSNREISHAKSGNWWEKNPQRARANNSAVLVRHRVEKEFFDEVWDRIQHSNSGEPGIYFTHDKDWGTNPCCEIGLRPFQFCNLCEVNVSNIESQEDLNERVKAAALVGTLQASYTDFHYLRPIWQRTTEKEALLGIGLTGIASGLAQEMDMKAAAKVAKDENVRVAARLGIRPANRVTTIKPSGTSSLVLGCSSGIHAWHNEYYIRRIRVGKNEDIYHYLSINHPELVEDEFFRPHDTAVISVPQKSPENAILRHESALSLLDRVKWFSKNWIKNGHKRGNNTHNISATISVKEDEWDTISNWMWENRNHYNGLSVLPYNGGSYKQAPFEDCDELTYKRMMDSLKDVDLTKITEYDDNTNLSGEIACAGGACDVKYV